jgi:hypothetical protein
MSLRAHRPLFSSETATDQKPALAVAATKDEQPILAVSDATSPGIARPISNTPVAFYGPVPPRASSGALYMEANVRGTPELRLTPPIPVIAKDQDNEVKGQTSRRDTSI